MILNMHSRTAALLGEAAMNRLNSSRVAIVGLGGVGGYAAECLARSGVGELVLIDGDRVETSNLNRQLFAIRDSLGVDKTMAASNRLSQVCEAKLTPIQAFINADNIATVLFGRFDYVVDAIDDLKGKIALICHCKDNSIPIISCMGAANKLDASAFKVTDIYKTEGCPLARRLRQQLRKQGVEGLDVVFSSELKHGGEMGVLGSLAPVVGACGMVAASWVINNLIKDLL